MDKKTATWAGIAKEDLQFAEQVLKNKQRPPYALHFCHQAVEKILKAMIQQVTGRIPPRTHNLEKLLKLTQKQLPPDKLEVLINLAPHYLSTKYPEDLSKFFNEYSFDFVSDQFRKVKELFLWIEKNWLT